MRMPKKIIRSKQLPVRGLRLRKDMERLYTHLTQVYSFLKRKS